jgi:hypothetical protein
MRGISSHGEVEGEADQEGVGERRQMLKGSVCISFQPLLEQITNSLVAYNKNVFSHSSQAKSPKARCQWPPLGAPEENLLGFRPWWPLIGWWSHQSNHTPSSLTCVSLPL